MTDLTSLSWVLHGAETSGGGQELQASFSGRNGIYDMRHCARTIRIRYTLQNNEAQYAHCGGGGGGGGESTLLECTFIYKYDHVVRYRVQYSFMTTSTHKHTHTHTHTHTHLSIRVVLCEHVHSLTTRSVRHSQKQISSH